MLYIERVLQIGQIPSFEKQLLKKQEQLLCEIPRILSSL